MTSRGRLLDASLKAFENNCHGNIAEYTSKVYGALPSLGSLATRPKITVKTIMVNNGRRMAQAIPMTVCL